MTAPFRVRVLCGDRVVSEQIFNDTLVKIGKHASAQVRLTDRSAGAIHAVLTTEGEAIAVTDVSGARGTRVNGKPVGKRVLAPGDEIRIAGLRILVDRPEAEQAAAPVPEPTSLTLPPAELPSAPVLAVAAPEKPEKLETPAKQPPPRAEPLDSPALQLACYWGQTLLGVSQHARPETVLMGQTRRCALKVGGEERVIAEALGEDFALRVDPGSKAQRRRGERVEELGPGVHLLTPSDSAWVEAGGLRVEASFANKPARAKVPFAALVDYRLANLILALTFVAGLFAVSASTAQPANLIADDFEMPGAVRIIAQSFPPPKKAEQRSDATSALSDPEPAAPKHSGAEGEAGDPNKPRLKPKIGKVGKIDGRGLLAASGALAILGSGNPVGQLVDGNDVGRSLNAALGNLTGSTLGANGGFGGMGLRDHGPGGGGANDHTYGIGGNLFSPGRGLRNGKAHGPTLAPGEKVAPPPPDMTSPEIGGALDPELVRQVIHSHVSQIRFCYEQELARQPSLSGKIRVRFMVGPKGEVPTAAIAEGTTIDASELRNCILSRVRQWIFPSPKGGGSAIVTYPFWLRPSGE